MMILKTLTFAVMHVAVAFTVVYAMTGDVMVGGAVALIEPLCNSVAYFFHEQLWARKRLHAQPIDAETPALAMVKCR